MNGTCSTHGGKRYAGFWWREDLEEGEGFEGLCVSGRIILNGCVNKDGGRAWIGFIWLDRDKRRNFVHAVMYFRIPQMSGIFLTS
jgi:hypothetical protein